ncbi:MAG: hypothetical protein IIU59_07670, partial [Alistipes sp.]|nr:hypothetical protein [Alistipes sp.]
IKVLCNVDIFGEGFDCPDVDFIQLARPTKSLSLYLQQVGRGLRRTENKTKVLIIDNVGSFSRFGLPTKDRNWQLHFEGKYSYDQTTDTFSHNQIDYTPSVDEVSHIIQKRNEYGLSVEIKELKQNEDLTYLSSLFLNVDSEISYEPQFYKYASSYLKRNDVTINNWIKDISRIDHYIQSHINNKFIGIFYTIDTDVLNRWSEELLKIDSFNRFDNKYGNTLIKPSFERYVRFASSFNNTTEIEKEWEKELNIHKHQHQTELIDHILSNQSKCVSKNDLEITIATLSKIGILHNMPDFIKNKLLSSYQQELEITNKM